MRFFEDMTQSSTGDRLDISQMHVSRLISHACARVRDEAFSRRPAAAAHRDTDRSRYFLVVLPINKLHERLAPHQLVQASPKGTASNASAPYAPRPGAAPPAPSPCPLKAGETTQRAG